MANKYMSQKVKGGRWGTESYSGESWKWGKTGTEINQNEACMKIS